MRISDWSSDVCSSDLLDPAVGQGTDEAQELDGVAGALLGHHQHPLPRNEAAVPGPDPGRSVFFEYPRPFRPVLVLGEPAGVVAACQQARSEERRVGKECVSTCGSRWSPYP